MRKPRAVLFDAVGTLIYPVPSVIDVYHRIGQIHGSAKIEEEVAERLRKAMAVRWPDELNSSDDLERQRWRDVVASVFDDVPRIDPLFDEL